MAYTRDGIRVVAIISTPEGHEVILGAVEDNELQELRSVKFKKKPSKKEIDDEIEKFKNEREKRKLGDADA
jgi:predicted phosphoribosyltransferase